MAASPPTASATGTRQWPGPGHQRPRPRRSSGRRPVPDPDAVQAAVLDDVREGLGRLLTVDNVWVPEPFDTPATITQGNRSVVVWAAIGKNTIDIGNQRHTDRPVNVEGVTIVDHPDEDSDDWTYYRFVDWNAIAAQIGTSRGRVTVAHTEGPLFLHKGDQPRGPLVASDETVGPIL